MERKKAVKFITAIMLAVTLSLSLVVACPSFSITSKAAGASDPYNSFNFTNTAFVRYVRAFSGQPLKIKIYFNGTLALAPKSAFGFTFHLNHNLSDGSVDTNYQIEYTNVHVYWSSTEYIPVVDASNNLYNSYTTWIENHSDYYINDYFYIEADATVYYVNSERYSSNQLGQSYRIPESTTSGTFKFTTPKQVVTYALKNQLMWIKAYLPSSTGRVDTWKIELPDIKAETPSYDTQGNFQFKTPQNYIYGDGTSSKIYDYGFNKSVTFGCFVDWQAFTNDRYGFGTYTTNEIYHSLETTNDILSLIYTAVQGMNTSTLVQESQKQTAELEKQTEEAKKQTEEQKKQTEALTKYENADKMDTEAGNLTGVIDDYDKISDSIFESAGGGIADFDITVGFDFGGKIIAAIGLLGTIMTNIILSMGDFSMLYTVGVCMALVGILTGLYKYFVSEIKDENKPDRGGKRGGKP